MAKLRGLLQSDNSTASRLSKDTICSRLNTDDGRIIITLRADGDFSVSILGTDYSPRSIAKGNINTGAFRTEDSRL